MSRRIAGYDAGLVLSVLAILGASIYLLLTAITLIGADGLPVQTDSFGRRQAVFAVIGCLLAIVLSRIGSAQLERRWHAAYALALAGIAIVFVLGPAIRGSRRWIELGPVNVQPSELGKVLLIVGIAGFMTGRARDIQATRMYLSVLALCALPAAMVFVQPDFGTAQIYGFIALGLLFFGGARWLHLGLTTGAVVVLAALVLWALPAVGIQVLHDFQMQRLTGFLNPEDDPQGANYQASQSKIAIGSGQLTGKAAGEASQVGSAFLPEPQTDFVFATLGERHGFLGCALLLALYMLLLSRCLYAVSVAPTMFGRIVCGAVTAMLASQVVINVGMVIGLMPITGVPLPLFSYGGSAMLANLAGIGIVAGVLRESESAQVRYARRAGGLAARALMSTIASQRARGRARSRMRH